MSVWPSTFSSSKTLTAINLFIVHIDDHFDFFSSYSFALLLRLLACHIRMHFLWCVGITVCILSLCDMVWSIITKIIISIIVITIMIIIIVKCEGQGIKAKIYSVLVINQNIFYNTFRINKRPLSLAFSHSLTLFLSNVVLLLFAYLVLLNLNFWAIVRVEYMYSIALECIRMHRPRIFEYHTSHT